MAISHKFVECVNFLERQNIILWKKGTYCFCYCDERRLGDIIIQVQFQILFFITFAHLSLITTSTSGLEQSKCAIAPVVMDEDADQKSTRKEETMSSHEKHIPKPVPNSQGDNKYAGIVNWKSGEIVAPDVPADKNTSGEVNSEASMTTDDVIRAGGFGARDDINSFLPVASDSTDFEESILEARNYEEPQGEVRRPGLGWKQSAEED
ncbi:uncharacterized protein LOC126678385 [Mercurialis annua]|uniref:uncharacterized protein LOC126678385 n=1 Tax=Mercurialis annua TaxID=3986 RepID=UPI002160692E|nr:uncharacterized protein LOC126678385 [Mercurialis annua]